MNAIRSGRQATTASASIGLVALFGLPFALGDYTLSLCTTALIYAILAVSLDLVWGQTGVIDLGHTIWFGLGCLAVAISTTSVNPETYLIDALHTAPERYVLGTILGILVAGAIALALGWWVFSFRGGGSLYVVVVTLAASVVAGIIYTQEASVTGGDNGLFGFNSPGLTPHSGYWLCAAVLVLVIGGALVLVRSDFGLALRAVRDNEERAGYLGINALAVKSFAFVAGAVVAALAGGLYGAVDGVLSSPIVGFVFATEVLIWVAVGGRGTIIGPAIAAFGMALATSLLDANYSAQWLLVQGVLFVLIVLFLPDGLLPALLQVCRRLFGVRSSAARARVIRVGEPIAREREPRASIEVRALHVSYGSLKALRGVDLEIRQSELLAIVGPNGAGKSTLLGVLADGRISRSGDVEVLFGERRQHRGMAPFRLARSGLVRKLQVPELFSTLTPAEIFVLAMSHGRGLSKWKRTTALDIPREAADVLQIAGALDCENRISSELSHGLRQGIEIALAVAMAPTALLLDEPTAGLTLTERQAIGGVLRTLAETGIAVVLIEHDLDFVEQVADRVAVLHDGTIVHDGVPSSLREAESVRTAYMGLPE